MKLVKKALMMLCFTLLCIAFVPSTVQAASKTPAKVKIQKATAGESQVTLKWKAVSNATGYYVYQLDEESNTYTRIKTVKAARYPSLVIKKLTNSTAYTFSVSAYRKVGTKIYEGKKSNVVTVTPQVKKPAVVKVTISKCANKSVSLKWNKVSGATGYEVFQKDKTTGKFVSIGTTKKTAVKISKLENGVNYEFKVRAYRKAYGITRNGNLSSSVTAKPIAPTKEVSSIHSMYYKAKVRATVKAKTTDGSKTVTVKAGTSVTVTKRASTATVKLKNGTSVYMSNGYLSYVSCITDSSKDYSTQTKENFVNSKGYASTSKYLIWINLPKQHFYIFKGSQCNWKLYKTYKCASGMAATPTPPGRYTLRRKAPFFRFDEDCFAYNASFFSGNAIHSWLYVNGGAKYYDGHNGQVGWPASHGCVRLENKNAKFVYDKIPLGTTIIIY